MTRTVVTVEGLDEFRANLDKLSEAMAGKAVTRALLDGADLIQREAKHRAPVLKEPTPWRVAGALKAAIARFPVAFNHVLVRVRNKGEARRQLRQRGRIRRGATDPRNPHYWWHVEFGTRNMAAQPFLRPAFEARKHEALAAIVRALRDTVQTAGRHMQRRRRGR